MKTAEDYQNCMTKNKEKNCVKSRQLSGNTTKNMMPFITKTYFLMQCTWKTQTIIITNTIQICIIKFETLGNPKVVIKVVFLNQKKNN